MFLVEICCAYLPQIFLYFFTLSVTMIFILYTSQRFLETFFFVLGNGFRFGSGNGFRFGSKTATEYSQSFSEAVVILGLRVDFTKQSTPSPHRIWR